MDESIIRYYRRLLKEDFPHAGELALPTIFVEAVGERLIHCGNTGNYMQLYLQVADGRIREIKYLCSCEPAANVAVEVLCALAQGKTLDEAAALTDEAVYRCVGSRDEAFAQKVRGILALFNEGIARYQSAGDGQGTTKEDAGAPGSHLTWDRSYNA